MFFKERRILRQPPTEKRPKNVIDIRYGALSASTDKKRRAAVAEALGCDSDAAKLRSQAGGHTQIVIKTNEAEKIYI